MDAPSHNDGDGGGSRTSLAALLAAALAGCVSLFTGYSALESVPTGPYSERIVLEEASRMAEGDHRFGIVEYSHYPNGPTYIVAMLRPLDLRVATLRLIPVAVMALAVGWLVFVLWPLAATTVSRAWILVGIGELLLQPGVRHWQGALHEHSYVVSLTLVALALSVVVTPRSSWVLAPFGFVLGWIGYDWIPGQLTAVLVGRWLIHCVEPDANLLRAGLRACLDAMRVASGVALAVLGHLLQLGFYFGSVEAALRDLIGSAAGRAGLEAASTINPDYGSLLEEGAQRMQAWVEARPDFESTYGEDYDASDPQRWRLPGILLTYFLKPRWTSTVELAGLALAGIVVLAEGLRVWSRDRQPSMGLLARRVLIGAVAVVLALGAGAFWSVLLPNHASDHVHSVPRHYFMSMAILVPIPILLFAAPSRFAPSKEGLLSLADWLYAVPLLALGVVFIATVVWLG